MRVLWRKTLIMAYGIIHRMSTHQVCGAALLSLMLLFVTLIGHLSAQDDDRILVIAAGEALASVVEEIGGEHVNVRNILPPGVDPHNYEPSAQELLSLVGGASLIVITGPHHFPVEEKIEQLSREGLIRARILNYRNYQKEGLRLLEVDGGLNPHGYFFSLSGLKAIARACAKELSGLMPNKSEYFKQRLNAYLEKLALIGDVVKHMNVAGVRVALVDPILQYIAQDLGLEVEEVLIPSHGVEPPPEEVIKIVRLVQEGKISLVLLSDIGLGDGSAIISTLEENNVPYALIPILDFSKRPELAPIYTASIVKDRVQPLVGIRGTSSLSETFLAPSLAANCVLGLITLLLIMKVRRHG